MTAKKKTYSYIRHPFCKNGWYSFGISVLSFVITQFVVVRAVSADGAVGMSTAAFGISAVLLDLAGMNFTTMSFREKEKNYTFAVIGAILGIFVLIEWVYIFSRR